MRLAALDVVILRTLIDAHWAALDACEPCARDWRAWARSVGSTAADWDHIVLLLSGTLDSVPETTETKAGMVCSECAVALTRLNRNWASVRCVAIYVEEVLLCAVPPSIDDTRAIAEHGAAATSNSGGCSRDL